MIKSLIVALSGSCKYLKEMRNVIKILVILLICFCSCKNPNNKNGLNNIDEKTVILQNTEHYEWLEKNYGYKKWMPKADDIKIVEKIIQKAIENKEFDFLEEPISENLKIYYQQYIPYINKNGERIIEINAFCEILEFPPNLENGDTEWTKMNLKKEYIIVDDGGDCYWQITINLDKMEYRDLKVNGVA